MDLIDLLPDGLLFVDPFGNIVQINDQALSMFGYQRDELVGKSIENLIPEALREKHQQHRDKYLDNPKYRPMGVGLYLKALRKDGSEFPVDISLGTIETPEGKLITASVRDITETIEIQDQLRKSDQRYKALVDNTNDGVYLVDFEGIYLDVNICGEEMLGVSREEIIGKDLSDFIAPEEAEYAAHRIERLLAGEEMNIFERNFIRKDGTTFPGEINLTLVQDLDGNPAYIQSIVRDISERKDREKKLSESEARYRLLFELAPLPIALIEGTTFRYINLAGMVMLGASDMHEIIGKSFKDFIHPDDYIVLEERVSMVESGIILPRHIYHMIDLHGQNLYVEVRSSPTRIDDKLTLLTIFRDVTSQLQLEQELLVIDNLSEALGQSSSPMDMVPVVMEQVSELVDAKGTVLAIYDPVQEDYVIKAADGVWEEVLDHRIEYKTGVTGVVVESGEMYLNNDVPNNPDPRFNKPEMIARVKAVVCMPIKAQEEIIGALWVGKDTSINAEDLQVIRTICNISGGALHRAYLTEELENTFVESVLALAKALDVRNTQTADHSHNMATYAAETIQHLGGSEDDMRIIRLAALLHDIGKIGIPDDILLKPGPLTEEEREVIKRHPDIGAEIVAPIQQLAEVAPIIRAHQELFNGTGYPNGLKGEEIPLQARVLKVVDSYLAITEDRVYRSARKPLEAVKELKDNIGIDFDPQAVEAFLVILKSKKEI